jgi:hypothetical protein
VTKECLEVAGSSANFLGGVVLLVDALRVRNNINRESVSLDFLNALRTAGSADRAENKEGQPLSTEADVKKWLSKSSLVRAWMGFALMIAGFGCEIASHFFA